MIGTKPESSGNLASVLTRRHLSSSCLPLYERSVYPADIYRWVLLSKRKKKTCTNSEKLQEYTNFISTLFGFYFTFFFKVTKHTEEIQINCTNTHSSFFTRNSNLYSEIPYHLHTFEKQCLLILLLYFFFSKLVNCND